MTEKNIQEITSFALDIYNGEYESPIPQFDNEALDTLTLALSTIGDELKDQTLSKDYFEIVFRENKNMIFILSDTGKVVHLNKQAIESITTDLTYDDEAFDVFQLFSFPLDSDPTGDLKKILLSKLDGETVEYQGKLRGKNKIIPVVAHCHFIPQINQFALMLEDVSFKKLQEQRLMRAILDTQIKEQNKIAKELHDSVTQNLSGAKMMISQILKMNDSPELTDVLATLHQVVDESIIEIRDISHNLMPSYLRFSLYESISHLMDKIMVYAPFDIDCTISKNLPELDVSYKSAVYRITQEFVNNTIKYSNAKKLTLHFDFKDDKISFLLRDDGIGFDIQNKTIFENGIGLNNIISRIKIFDHDYHFNSYKGKGTSLFFSLTITNHTP